MLIFNFCELLTSFGSRIEYSVALILITNVALLLSESHLPVLLELREAEVLLLAKHATLDIIVKQGGREACLPLEDQSIAEILLSNSLISIIELLRKALALVSQVPLEIIS